MSVNGIIKEMNDIGFKTSNGFEVKFGYTPIPKSAKGTIQITIISNDCKDTPLETIIYENHPIPKFELLDD